MKLNQTSVNFQIIDKALDCILTFLLENINILKFQFHTCEMIFFCQIIQE